LGGPITLTTATVKEQGENSPAEPFITAKRGERLLIRCITTSDHTESAVVSAMNWIVSGQTAVLKGNRIVDQVNFLA
jgi:hypothetical protein